MGERGGRRTGKDQAACEVFELLSGLNEEVAWRELDGDALAGVAGPDVETGVARTTVDGEEVEICVEASEDCQGVRVITWLVESISNSLSPSRPYLSRFVAVGARR